MTNKERVLINIAPREVLASAYGTRPYSSKTAKEVEQTVDEISPLLTPSMIYNWVNVISAGKNEVRLACPENETKLTLCLGRHTHLLKNARVCLIAVWTIGPALDHKINNLNLEENAFKSFLYNSIGLVALAKTYDAVKDMAECRARKKNWGISPLLSPGSLDDWHLEEQNKLCSILELEKFNITINNHSVLVPFKSASGLLGIGPGYDTEAAGSMCRLCTKNKTCPQKNMEK